MVNCKRNKYCRHPCIFQNCSSVIGNFWLYFFIGNLDKLPYNSCVSKLRQTGWCDRLNSVVYCKVNEIFWVWVKFVRVSLYILEIVSVLVLWNLLNRGVNLLSEPIPKHVTTKSYHFLSYQHTYHSFSSFIFIHSLIEMTRYIFWRAEQGCDFCGLVVTVRFLHEMWVLFQIKLIFCVDMFEYSA